MNRPCKHPGCPAIIREQGRRYCEKHEQRGQAAALEQRIDYNRQRRDPRAIRFYASAEWQRMRHEVLTADPVCRLCRVAWARHVHHIVPLAIDWLLRLTRSNLAGLCAPCHTTIENGTATLPAVSPPTL